MGLLLPSNVAGLELHADDRRDRHLLALEADQPASNLHPPQDRVLRLPFYNDLTEADQARVVDAVRDFGS